MPVSKPRKKKNQQRRPPIPVQESRQLEPVSVSAVRIRRFSGFVLIGAGLTLVVANWLAIAGVDIMPGGHKTLYFLAGLGIAAGGAGLLGIFRSD